MPASQTVALDTVGRERLLDALRWTLSTAGFLDITDPAVPPPREVLAQALAQLVDGAPGYYAHVGSEDLRASAAFRQQLAESGWKEPEEPDLPWSRVWDEQTDATLGRVADALISVLAGPFGLTRMTIDLET